MEAPSNFRKTRGKMNRSRQLLCLLLPRPQIIFSGSTPFYNRTTEQSMPLHKRRKSGAMGNCLAAEAGPDLVRIMSDSGGIMELESPVNVKTVVSDFPGYGIFRRGNVGSPLLHHEKLLSGHLYYLLPVPKGKTAPATEKEAEPEAEPAAKQVQVAPVRLSTAEPSELQSMEVLPSPGKGVWRVKMVIRRDELADILSEQGNTEALIERLRLAATSSEAQRKRAWSSWASSRRLTINDPSTIATEEDQKKP